MLDEINQTAKIWNLNLGAAVFRDSFAETPETTNTSSPKNKQTNKKLSSKRLKACLFTSISLEWSFPGVYTVIINLALVKDRLQNSVSKPNHWCYLFRLYSVRKKIKPNLVMLPLVYWIVKLIFISLIPNPKYTSRCWFKHQMIDTNQKLFWKQAVSLWAFFPLTASFMLFLAPTISISACLPPALTVVLDWKVIWWDSPSPFHQYC